VKNISMRSPLFAISLLAFAGLLAAGASVAFGQQTSEKRSHTTLRDAPAKAQARPNPMESEPDAVAAGGKLFEEHCAECHGRKGEGTRRAPSLLRQEMQQASPGAIFWVLTNGVVRRGMPDWSKLPEPERWQIVTFLKSFRAERETKESGDR
jgi:mono/diheme cytochrome c family protein